MLYGIYNNFWRLYKVSIRDKSAKFVELAEKRVNRAINDMRLIGNLSNKNYYDYTDDQSKKIIRALQQELENIKKSFQSSSNDLSDKFKL